METRVPSEGRRSILKRGALGAASIAAVAVAAGATTSSPKNATTATNGSTTMRLLGRAWHADTEGKLPGKGDRYAVYGELTDGAGRKVGEFFSQNVGVDSPFHVTGEGIGAFEIHTLTLPGGTIIGTGIGGGSERAFAIVGGTGKYAGARGSYQARQDTYGLGGDGKAEILLTLLD